MVYFIKSLLCHAIIVIVGWLHVGKAWVHGKFWANFPLLGNEFFLVKIAYSCLFLV
jgi:hypothetical protein